MNFPWERYSCNFRLMAGVESMNIQRFCIQNKYLSPFCCHKPQIINKLSQTYDLSLYGNFFDNLHLFKFDQSNEALDSCNYKGILVCESDMFDT